MNVLTKLARVSETARATHAERDNLIVEARKEHSPTEIAQATGLTPGRIVQIVKKRRTRGR